MDVFHPHPNPRQTPQGICGVSVDVRRLHGETGTTAVGHFVRPLLREETALVVTRVLSPIDVGAHSGYSLPENEGDGVPQITATVADDSYARPLSA